MFFDEAIALHVRDIVFMKEAIFYSTDPKQVESYHQLIDQYEGDILEQDLEYLLSAREILLHPLRLDYADKDAEIAYINELISRKQERGR